MAARRAGMLAHIDEDHGQRKTVRAFGLGILRYLMATVLVALAAGGNASAAEPFYKGKSITFVIGSGVGGGYDTYSRLVAAHLGQHLDGRPSIVPQNMPGAGSIRAANYLYN